MNKVVLIKSASILSIVVATIILISKIYGWFITSSISILASLIDSMLDISASAINLIAINISTAPSDDDHRFGHNKVQDLAIFAQAVFFMGSGIFALTSAIKSLVLFDYMSEQEVGMNVMIISIILTTVLVIYQQFVVYKTNSKIILADKMHYFSDLLTNLITLLSIYLSSKWGFVDSILGACVALYIMRMSYKLLRMSIDNLIDTEFSDEEKEKIFDVLRNFPEALGVHEMKTRHAGEKAFIQFHLELDKDLSLLHAHDIAEKVEVEIKKVFPGSEVIIHQDPFGIEELVEYREDHRLKKKL